MKRNSMMQLWLSLVLLTVILVVSVLFYIDNLNENFEREVFRTLEEVSSQEAMAIETEIQRKQDMLSDLSHVMEIDIDAEPDAILKSVHTQLQPIVEENGLRGMGVALEDGRAYSTRGEITDIKDQEFYQRAWNGESVLSGRITLNRVAKDYVNVYATPIHDEKTGEVIGVLYATYNTRNFRSTMETPSFHGEGYSYMVDAKGDTVVDSSHATSFQNMENIFTSIEEADGKNATMANELRQLMEQREAGRIVFRNKVDKYLYCYPLSVNNWYLLTVVPVSVVDTQINVVVRNTIILVVVLAGIFIAMILLLVNQYRKKQAELKTLAYVDPVTGGDTFAKFQMDYEETVSGCPNVSFALLSLDLNRFKMINDMYGSEEGDRILQNMDRIWKEIFREHEYCGHRMADRFAVLLTYQSREELELRIRDYRKLLRETTKNRYNLSLRIGVYLLQGTKESFSTAYSRSMMAFAAAKDSEKHFYAFYNEEMEEQLIWEKLVEDDFDTALKNKEFVVFYQAKINSETQQITGAEALVRWIRPDGTIIPPGRFIPVLENNDSIVELDRYMFREVCLQQKQWLDEGKSIVPVSVNLSRVQLADRNLVDYYQRILDETGLPPEYIGLEFTESAMFNNEEILRDTVDRLHDMGMKVLIDDFGVGYSSMMSLKVIPVDILKVDKSFIDSIGDERGDKIVISIIEFATSLGMSVTAEGVENDEQYQFLQAHRCDDIQGYYFSRPVPADEYEKRFLNRRAIG
ncbi:eAL domain-containing protein [Clostridium sp. CAG:632]|nr:eAL domain-containing protein [Clostridium sp. CAG:632]